jgi:hypothetical protein
MRLPHSPSAIHSTAMSPSNGESTSRFKRILDSVSHPIAMPETMMTPFHLATFKSTQRKKEDERS